MKPIKVFEDDVYAGVLLTYLGKDLVRLEQPILVDGYEIPAGFICDLDSVPRNLGIFYAWFKNRTILGAIVHDFIYSLVKLHGYNTHEGQQLKEYGDALFKKVMKWEGVKYRYRNPIYLACKWFGWSALKNAR